MDTTITTGEKLQPTTDTNEQAKIVKRLFGMLYDFQQLMKEQNLLAADRLKWIDDCLTEIEVGYQGKSAVNNYGETLKAQNFELTFEEAFDSLMERLRDSTFFLQDDYQGARTLPASPEVQPREAVDPR